MNPKTDPLESRSFRLAQTRAEGYAQDPERLGQLVEKATRKADSRAGGALRASWESFQSLLRLVKAYAKGTYRTTPWKSLLMGIAGLVYFIMPFDVVPDFLLGLGFLDDAAVLALILQSIRGDLEAFVRWENEQLPSSDIVISTGDPSSEHPDRP